MAMAIELAKEAGAQEDVPVGAVIVKDGKVIAVGRNRREEAHDPSAHAEMEAIREAGKALGSWRLDDCDLYVTLEPCPMCAGAMINARIKTVIFGAFDPKAGSCSPDSVINLFALPYNHRPEVYGGICEEECKALLRDFFAKKRGTA